MYYSTLVEIYSELEKTSKRLEKVDIISRLLKNCTEEYLDKLICLIQGRVFFHNDVREMGMSSKLVLKAIAKSAGVSESEVEREWKVKGDLGSVGEKLISKRKQTTLMKVKLTVNKVFDNLYKLAGLGGKGAVEKKISFVSELLLSAEGSEVRFIIRTVLGELRVGVADGVIRDSIAKAYDADVKQVERAFDISLDFGDVARKAKRKKLSNVMLNVGKPSKVMLAIKVENVNEAFSAVGKPAMLEPKLDGFRVTIHKKNNSVSLFTRSMENVTKQFNEVLPVINENVKCDECILDSEFVGYDQKTKKYLPFQNISQRIKRKYRIDEIAKRFPVEVNVFDILHYNGKDLFNQTQEERRKLIEKIVQKKPYGIKLTEKLITDNEKKAAMFFKKALKEGNEGLIFKKLDACYQPGRRVNGWVKLKTTLEPLDLVIIGADWGTGKRAGVLSSFVLGCKDENGFLECGMLGTGIKEKSEEGVSFKELTKLLKPLIIDEKGRTVKLRPKIVIEVNYEEIQKSPTYSSGFALRFPRLSRIRTNDKSVYDINTLRDIERLYRSQKK